MCGVLVRERRGLSGTYGVLVGFVSRHNLPSISQSQLATARMSPFVRAETRADALRVLQMTGDSGTHAFDQCFQRRVVNLRQQRLFSHWDAIPRTATRI